MKKRPTNGKRSQNEYRKVMADIRGEMSKPASQFSRFIHNGFVDKLSEFINRFILRPVPVLVGVSTALGIMCAAYLSAKYFGYEFSNVVPAGAFVFGWTIGMIIDFARIGFRNKNN